MTKDGDPNKRCDIVFLVYLITHGDKKILVDAGCETMPGFEMRNFCGTVAALERENVTPEEITDVIITHSHHDHVECVKYFKNAVIHIQKDEYEDGRKYIPDGFRVNIFDEEETLYDVIKAVKIGGHSKGSCVVELAVDEKKCVIVADECYLAEYFERNAEIARLDGSVLYEKFFKKYGGGEYLVLYSHDECCYRELS